MDSPVSDFGRKLRFRSDSHWQRLQYLTGRTGPLLQIAGGVSYNDLWTEYYGQKKIFYKEARTSTIWSNRREDRKHRQGFGIVMESQTVKH